MSCNTFHGDGISIPLFHHLWKKSKTNKLKLNVPDTVIYLFGHASVWYFTSSAGKKDDPNHGLILRKRKQNVTNDKIYEGFTSGLSSKNRGNGGIIAYFISSDKKNERHEQNGIKGGAVATTSIQYFNRESLHDFLYDSRKDCCGILQRFIVPRGSQNSMICAIWSPKFCHLERRTNKCHLSDERHVPNMYERAVTFEGPLSCSISTPLHGTGLSGQIQNVCKNIVKHIKETSDEYLQITRMMLMFKIDAKDRLWFQWSTSIRLNNSESKATFLSENLSSPLDPLDLQARYELPSSIKLCPVVPSESKTMEKYEKNCISCGKQLSEIDEMHPVPYKTVIAHFEQIIRLAQQSADDGKRMKWPPEERIVKAGGGVGFGCIERNGNPSVPPIEHLTIPPIIRKLHTRLKVTGYKRYRNDPLFLHRVCKVCETCFLSYANLVTSGFYVVLPIEVNEGENDIASKKDMIDTTKTSQKLGLSSSLKWQPIKNGDELGANVGSFETSNRRIEFSETPEIPEPIVIVDQDTNESKDSSIIDFEEKINNMINEEPLASASLTMSEVMLRKEESMLLALARDPSKKPQFGENPLHHLIEAHQTLITPKENLVSKKKGNPAKYKNPYSIPLKLIDGSTKKESITKRNRKVLCRKVNNDNVSNDVVNFSRIDSLEAMIKDLNDQNKDAQEFVTTKSF